MYYRLLWNEGIKPSICCDRKQICVVHMKLSLLHHKEKKKFTWAWSVRLWLFHITTLPSCLWFEDRTTALPVRTGVGGEGWIMMAIMIISQCNKTRRVALGLNQQALRRLLSLFQLNKITFPDLSLQSRDTYYKSYMLTIKQLSVALIK